MPPSPTALFRFRIELADIDRSVYESLDFRVAQHPSEILPYLLTRVLAFALNSQDGLAFSTGGLSDPDAPAISLPSVRGGTELWIEIGNPSARKLHKASKAADKVRVYTYKNPEALVREVAEGDVHGAENIDLFSISNDFLETLAAWLQRENRWSLTNTEGSLTVAVDDNSVTSDLIRHQLASVSNR